MLNKGAYLSFKNISDSECMFVLEIYLKRVYFSFRYITESEKGVYFAFTNITENGVVLFCSSRQNDSKTFSTLNKWTHLNCFEKVDKYIVYEK